MSAPKCHNCRADLRRYGRTRRGPHQPVILTPYIAHHYVTHTGIRTCLACGVLPRSVTKLAIGSKGYEESHKWVSENAQGGLF